MQCSRIDAKKHSLVVRGNQSKAWCTAWLHQLCDFGQVTQIEFSLSFLICKMKKKRLIHLKGLKHIQWFMLSNAGGGSFLLGCPLIPAHSRSAGS